MSSLNPQTRLSAKLRYLFSFFGFVSVALLAVIMVLVALDIPILWSIDRSSAGPAITATIVNPFVLLLLIATTVIAQDPGRGRSANRVALPIAAGVLAAIGICISLASFMIKRSRLDAVQKARRYSVGFEEELGSLLACAVAHVAFFITLVFIQQSASTTGSAAATNHEKQPSPTKPRAGILPALRIITQSERDSQAPTLRQRDSCMTSPILCRNSWHVTYDSPDGHPKPMDSQVRLISTRNSADSTLGALTEKHSPISTSPTAPGGRLDAIAVDHRLREVLAQAPPTWPHGTKLETIPGSRPTSKYIDDSNRDSFFSNEKSSPIVDAVVTIADTELMSSPPPSTTAGSGPPSPTRDTYTASILSNQPLRVPSRCVTPQGQEGHIHPLFRTDSPVPPPVASVNTTITASPFSGQVIPVPARSLSRNRSRTASPTMRRPSEIGQGTVSRSNSTCSTAPSSIINTIPEFVLTVNQEGMS